MTIGVRVVIAALFKKMIEIRYCKANETAHSCSVSYLIRYALCDTSTKLDVFVALHVFDCLFRVYRPSLRIFHSYGGVTMVDKGLKPFEPCSPLMVIKQ